MKKYDLFEVLLKSQNFSLSDEEEEYLETIDDTTKESVLLVLNSSSYEVEKTALLAKIAEDTSEVEKSVIK